MPDLNKFTETRSVKAQIGYKLKYYFLRRILRKSPKFFMNPSDIITRFTIAYNIHEKMVFELIKYLSQKNYNDFFIDIGANIGLTSAQTNGVFKQYFLVEPNPILSKILEVNVNMHLPKDSFEIFKFGLSDGDTEADLLIPKDNWGGAFILKGNAYEEKTLLQKDGKLNFDESLYLKKNVILRDADVFISDVIRKIKTAGSKSGILKIDVEGYEMKILTLVIPKIIEAGISCFVLFEQLDNKWSPTILENLVESELEMWVLDEKDPDVRSWAGIRFLAKTFFTGNVINNRLRRVTSECVTGNILIKI